MAQIAFEPSERLQRLLGFLDKDPDNEKLLADSASLALDEHGYELAAFLLDRQASTASLSPELMNLRGLAAINMGQFEEAAVAFGGLRDIGADDPAVRFNLAWAYAMQGRYADASDLLDDEAIGISARAPALKIQMMHHLEHYDEALEEGARLAELFPDNQELMGALATLAMDADKSDLARHYGAQAGDSSEGLAARGLFALDEASPDDALALFEHAIEVQPSNPRAWVGKGLGLLVTGKSEDAAVALQKGADLFGDHLGSWVAAGWAHFTGGDLGNARKCFDQAMAVDATFAETHGALAVLDLTEGKTESALEHAKIAQRLDRNSFGGALAQALLLEKSGHDEAAQKIVAKAMAAPVGIDGKSLAEALRSMAIGPKSQS